MTREEAIRVLEDDYDYAYGGDTSYNRKAYDMAISALENIGHLTDRPCDVCEFHKENGCCKWTCVFCGELFGGME